LGNLRLFVACVAIWGSTWLAIKFQLGHVAPEASVVYRFLLASILLFAYCLARSLPLSFTASQHGWIALQGLFMFSVSYIFVYYAEEHVVSGLVAVGYSASPLLGMFGMRLAFGTRVTRQVAMGSLLGIVGIAIVFWPQFGQLQGGGDTAMGAFFTVLAVVTSTIGSLFAQRNAHHQLPLWQSMAYGMLYGSIFSLVVALALGRPLGFELSPGYVASLLYLAILGSIIAFGAYLTFLKRVGTAVSGYIGVMVPIVALFLSAAFEGFRFGALTWLGIAISVVGNVIILRRR
jgi:drug/metabolite transporter (DMT)-like permease